jgi:hypothetical protein
MYSQGNSHTEPNITCSHSHIDKVNNTSSFKIVLLFILHFCQPEGESEKQLGRRLARQEHSQGQDSR